MKTLVKWLVKRYVTKDALKSAVRAANENLVKIEVKSAKAKDVSDLVGAYLLGFADGRVNAEELGAMNAKCDALIDKYVTDNAIEAAIDRVLA